MIIAVTLCEFNKPFNYVNHRCQITKIQNFFVFRTSPLQFFSTYLQDRQQCVDWHNQYSDVERIHYVLPQGSMLGPILSTMYIIDFYYHFMQMRHTKAEFWFRQKQTKYILGNHVDFRTYNSCWLQMEFTHRSIMQKAHIFNIVFISKERIIVRITTSDNVYWWVIQSRLTLGTWSGFWYPRCENHRSRSTSSYHYDTFFYFLPNLFIVQLHWADSLGVPGQVFRI